ncbi:FkbM family methyltransferase [Okeania sp. SIO2B3]|uniref:FkbM family methyltransferase n=1 Tax=Okeania sp. SIO2B3 TaxID=2607784 RepID=UPI0013C1C0A7|nr:FkbM family methyltransferase [Okeania sp. SIO2B3]NET44483.1 FkbM family methyltransferase [Okeania sp. SIO2B3]
MIKAIGSDSGYESRKKMEPSRPRNSFPSNMFEVQHELIKNLNKTDICIFDVGANKGQTAKIYRSQFPTAEIYCFEPFPDSIAELNRKFSDDPKIHIVPKAVAQEKGTATFYVNERNVTNSLLPRPSSARRYYPKSAKPKETIEVEVINLDEFLKESNISIVDILKFDIQGGELNALHGAESLLEAGSTALIYTEIMFIPHYEGAPFFHEIWSFLSKFNYSLFDIYNLSRATNGQIRQGDALFVSESVRKNVINKYPEEP